MAGIERIHRRVGCLRPPARWFRPGRWLEGYEPAPIAVVFRVFNPNTAVTGIDDCRRVRGVNGVGEVVLIEHGLGRPFGGVVPGRGDRARKQGEVAGGVVLGGRGEVFIGGKYLGEGLTIDKHLFRTVLAFDPQCETIVLAAVCEGPDRLAVPGGSSGTDLNFRFRVVRKLPFLDPSCRVLLGVRDFSVYVLPGFVVGPTLFSGPGSGGEEDAHGISPGIPHGVGGDVGLRKFVLLA